MLNNQFFPDIMQKNTIKRVNKIQFSGVFKLQQNCTTNNKKGIRCN
jgi:hypothetical protein